MTGTLNAIPKIEFQDCFRKRKNRWECVIQYNGDYFKGCQQPVDKNNNTCAEKLRQLLLRHTSYKRGVTCKTM